MQKILNDCQERRVKLPSELRDSIDLVLDAHELDPPIAGMSFHFEKTLGDINNLIGVRFDLEILANERHKGGDRGPRERAAAADVGGVLFHSCSALCRGRLHAQRRGHCPRSSTHDR